MFRRGWLWLGLITLLAAGLRFYQLSTLPPGLWFDEAWANLEARNLVAARTLPLYFPSAFGGLHPAIVYLAVLARWLTHNHPHAVRFGVAAVGTLSIPLAFGALRAIFRLDEDTAPHSETLGLLGALILSITFPYLLINRVGFEVILPGCAGLGVFWALAHAARTQRRRHYALAGVALGLALYTYHSARFLPVAVVVTLAWLTFQHQQWKKTAFGLSLVVAVSLLVFAPLGFYFLQHSSDFLTRAGLTAYNTLGPGAQVHGGAPLAILKNLGRTLAGFTVPGFGDGLMRHNLAGQPFYDAFLSLVFWLGALTAVLQPRRRSSALLLSWGAVMLLPTILTDNAPAFTRLMGAVPALSGLATLGAWRLFRTLAAHNKAIATSVLTLGLLFSTATTAYNYFGRWAADPRLYDAFQVGDWEAAQLARARLATDAVYIAPDLISEAHPTFDLLLADSTARGLNGAACLAYLPDTPATYIVEALNDSGRATADRLTALFPAGQWGAPILHQPERFPLFNVFHLPAHAEAAPSNTVSANFGDVAQLLGYALVPGDSLAITLYWKSLTPTDVDYTVFLHLAAPEALSAPPAAQADARPCAGEYGTPRWRPGEVVLDSHSLTLPPDLAPGPYVLLAGLYDLSSGARLPVTQANQHEPDRAWLGLIEIP